MPRFTFDYEIEPVAEENDLAEKEEADDNSSGDNSKSDGAPTEPVKIQIVIDGPEENVDVWYNSFYRF